MIIINYEIKNKILSLPKNLQYRIYITCMKEFWKKYVPLTAKIPSWYERKILIEKTIFEAKLKNIHFMHLPFNTLEENKKWIMGCQCDYCRKIKYKYKRKLYNKQFNNPNYFKSIMPHSSVSFCNEEEYLLNNTNFIMYNYDPLCGSGYEDNIKYSLRTNKPLKFDN
tara:strand:- start:198 stop:698 length:501 start_codon:yes stop_codon:yes gene_type:complete